MGRAYVVVEGHGEHVAVLKLLHRLAADLALPDVVWARPERLNKLGTEAGTREVCEALRRRGDCDRALLLRDDEDGCSRDDGPRIARWVRSCALPFPVAVVLFYREFETLFLPCLGVMAGRKAGDGRVLIRLGSQPESDPERRRGAKEWVSEFMDGGRRYKPTTDQLPLTQMLDFGVLRASGLPCFGTLERGLRVLLEATVPVVYPAAPTSAP